MEKKNRPFEEREEVISDDSEAPGRIKIDLEEVMEKVQELRELTANQVPIQVDAKPRFREPRGAMGGQS